MSVQKLLFSKSQAMLTAHIGAAAPVTAPEARLHGGPAGVCASGPTRASHTSARAAAPAPQGAADSMLFIMNFSIMRTEPFPRWLGRRSRRRHAASTSST